LSQDPVVGGSANDYDYVNADPINNLDLAGTRCWLGVKARRTVRVWDAKKHRRVSKTVETCNGAKDVTMNTARSGARGLSNWYKTNSRPDVIASRMGAAMGCYAGAEAFAVWVYRLVGDQGDAVAGLAGGVGCLVGVGVSIWGDPTFDPFRT
jgi:hypothetical protein